MILECDASANKYCQSDPLNSALEKCWRSLISQQRTAKPRRSFLGPYTGCLP